MGEAIQIAREFGKGWEERNPVFYYEERDAAERKTYLPYERGVRGIWRRR